MENDFSARFEIVYKKYCEQTGQMGIRPNETAFGRYVGVSKTTVQRWKGGQVPAAKDIKTIHDKLGFAWDWLISCEGEMFDESARLLAEKDAEIARLEAENRKLTTRLLHDGVTDERFSPDTAKAAGQE